MYCPAFLALNYNELNLKQDAFAFINLKNFRVILRVGY